MKLKLLVTMSVASLALAGCSATVTTNTTANVANKTANAANTVANAAGNTVNAVSNANTTNSNSNSMAAVDGDTIRIDEAGIMMTVPKGFKHSKDGEDIIVKTEDEGVDIRFTVPKDGDYNKALVDAATEVDDYLKDVKIEDKGSKTTVNGMEATTMSGTATNEGEPVMWDLTIINAPKKPVLVNIYAEKTSLEKHGPEVKKFLESVKKQ
ncbi:MAG: hypothetical protein M3Q99_10750 [Acidobacteriota bacterium]|nr:hypothetical protein [Acidobacteriota bacterium]